MFSEEETEKGGFYSPRSSLYSKQIIVRKVVMPDGTTREE
jgi:hypothetical protein